MHSAAPWRSSTSYTSSCSQDGVAHLDRPAQATGAPQSRNSSSRATLRCQRGGSCTSVGPERGSEPTHPVEVVRQPRARVAQLHAVRAELAELHRVHEARRRLGGPALDRSRGRQPVEGVVDLDGVEQLGVALEPASLRELGGIHRPAPVLVHPARAADPDVASSPLERGPQPRARSRDQLVEGDVALGRAHAQAWPTGGSSPTSSYASASPAGSTRLGRASPAPSARAPPALRWHPATRPAPVAPRRAPPPTSTRTPAPPRGWASGGGVPSRCPAST